MTTSFEQEINTLSDEMKGKVDSLNGKATALTVDATSTLAGVESGAIIADMHMLRRYGARFDGVTDDAPAFNAIINAATPPAGYEIPTVAFILPAGTILLKTPIISGNQNVSIRGQGAQHTILLADASNTSGIWQHGTSANPSDGYVEISSIMLHDAGRAQNGTTALTFCFKGGTAPTFRLNECMLRFFAQGIYLENPPRDINVTNLTIQGPDNTLQPGAAVTVISTETDRNVFTTTWTSCNLFNYTYGWRFKGGGMVEGHRFFACTAYNGWSMVQADMNPHALGEDKFYQAVLWDFTSCDWQGFGYALDMKNCRGVRVRGGFFTFNERTDTSGKTLVSPWGVRPSAATNVMMCFQDCADIIIEGVQFDLPLPAPSDPPNRLPFKETAFISFDAGCTHCRVQNNTFLTNSDMLFGIELGNRSGNDETPYNTMIVSTDNRFISWGGGDKVADHACKQIDGPWVHDQWLGTVTNEGVYDISQSKTVVFSSYTFPSGQTCAKASITYPKRRYGGRFFNGGVPNVTFTIGHSLALAGGPYQLGHVDNDSFDIIAPADRVGFQVTVNYRVTGL